MTIRQAAGTAKATNNGPRRPRHRPPSARTLRRAKRKTYRLFGGDAARQRAELYADKRGWKVGELGSEDHPMRSYGLDLFGRHPVDGIVYSYVATTH